MQTKLFFQKYFIFILLALFLLLASLTSNKFFTVRNLMNIIRQTSVLGFLSLGMSFVILTGNMDLSVGSILSFTGLIAILFQNFMPPLAAIFSAVLIGCAIGTINGLIIVGTHATSGDSLMITFGTQMAISGLCLIYTDGFSLPGSSSSFYNTIGTGMIMHTIPLPVILLLVVTLILGILEGGFSFGRVIHFMGYNPEASRLAGLKVSRAKILCFMISGGMAACGAVILSSRTLGATPTSGSGYEMDAIIAISLGGMSLSGGFGKIFNTLIGVILLGIIGNIMNLNGFVAYDQMIVKGIILILAVLINVKNTATNERRA